MVHHLRNGAAICALWAGAALAQQTDISIGMVLEPPNLDPTAGAAAAIDEVVYANIFEGLTRFGPDGSVNPGLARSWEISEDGTTYILHPALWRDLPRRRSDDGRGCGLHPGPRPRRGLDQRAARALFQYRRCAGAGRSTVQVTLDGPDGAFLFDMAWGDAVIVDPASADTNATNPIGTGAFRLARWVQGRPGGPRAQLEAYWGEPAALETRELPLHLRPQCRPSRR